MFAVRYGRTNVSLNAMLLRLIGAQAELQDRSRPLEKIKERQIDRWAKNFLEEGGIYEEWEQIAAYTTNDEGDEILGWTGRDRQAMGIDPEHPILIRTGGTFASFVSQNEESEVSTSAVDWTFRNTGGGARGGAYPLSHHTGYTTALSTVVPARPLWDFDDEDEDAAEQFIENYVDEIIARHF